MMGVLGGELYVMGGEGGAARDVEKFDGTSWQMVEPGLPQEFGYGMGSDGAIFVN